MPVNTGDYFDADAGIIWVQPDGPNTEPQPLLCHNLDSIDEPLGDTATRLCRTAAGGFKAVHRSQGFPGEGTFTIEAWLPKTRGWLQRQVARRCPIPVYVHMVSCGRKDLFLNYDYGELGKNAMITSRGKASLVRASADAGEGAADMSMMTFDMSVEPLSPEYWKLVESRRTIAEDEDLRDIAFCNPGQCLGPCGALEDICTDGAIVTDATAGSPSNTADVWFTVDGGATWTLGGADPFAGGEDIASVVCFQIDRNTTRHLVARGTLDGTAVMEIAYSDDAGTTWTNVNVGTTTSEFAMHSGALFALNSRNIWLVTDQGNVYYSSDAGLTWTDQGAPIPGAGVEELYYVHFIDENYGWTVGDNNHAMYTTDGGEHWTIVTGPGGAFDLTCVATIDAFRVWVGRGGGTGSLWFSNNSGTNWTQRALPNEGGTITYIGDVDFVDEFCGAVCGIIEIAATDYPIIWRTFNGGFSWEPYYDANNALDGAVNHQGNNAVWVCDYNHMYAVGEVSDATGVVAELEAAGA